MRFMAFFRFECAYFAIFQHFGKWNRPFGPIGLVCKGYPGGRLPCGFAGAIRRPSMPAGVRGSPLFGRGVGDWVVDFAWALPRVWIFSPALAVVATRQSLNHRELVRAS